MGGHQYTAIIIIGGSETALGWVILDSAFHLSSSKAVGAFPQGNHVRWSLYAAWHQHNNHRGVIAQHLEKADLGGSNELFKCRVFSLAAFRLSCPGRMLNPFRCLTVFHQRGQLLSVM